MMFKSKRVNSRPPSVWLWALLLLWASCAPAPASKSAPARQIIYNAARGTAPDAQGWLFFTTGGGQTKPGRTGATTFSTLGSLAYQGGYSLFVPFDLNRVPGYTISFDLQVVTETHDRPNRAGVDLIVLGSDRKGIELGFWTDQVWAQSDKPLFLHDESAPLATTAALIHYDLAVKGSVYRLSAGGKPLLTGAVRDYTAFQGPLNPYQTPNFLFLGDDSHSAEGKFRIARISVARNTPDRKRIRGRK